jgi:hypothetical protein
MVDPRLLYILLLQGFAFIIGVLGMIIALYVIIKIVIDIKRGG